MQAHSELITAPAQPTAVVIALGSNLGDSQRILAEAVTALREHPDVWVRAVSPLAKTAPVGGPAQPDFLNQIVLADTVLAPTALLGLAQQLERAAARVRDIRWGPRTLDVDIISYHGVVSADPDLTLPHPRAHERAFVLAPWSWADPRAVLDGVPVSQLAAAAGDAATVQRLDDGAASTSDDRDPS